MSSSAGITAHHEEWVSRSPSCTYHSTGEALLSISARLVLAAERQHDGALHETAA